MLDKYDIPAEKISLVLSCLGVQGRNKCVDLYVSRCWNVLVAVVGQDEEVDCHPHFSQLSHIIFLKSSWIARLE